MQNIIFCIIVTLTFDLWTWEWIFLSISVDCFTGTEPSWQEENQLQTLLSDSSIVRENFSDGVSVISIPILMNHCPDGQVVYESDWKAKSHWFDSERRHKHVFFTCFPSLQIVGVLTDRRSPCK